MTGICSCYTHNRVNNIPKYFWYLYIYLFLIRSYQIAFCNLHIDSWSIQWSRPCQRDTNTVSIIISDEPEPKLGSDWDLGLTFWKGPSHYPGLVWTFYKGPENCLIYHIDANTTAHLNRAVVLFASIWCLVIIRSSLSLDLYFFRRA